MIIRLGTLGGAVASGAIRQPAPAEEAQYYMDMYDLRSAQAAGRPQSGGEGVAKLALGVGAGWECRRGTRRRDDSRGMCIRAETAMCATTCGNLSRLGGDARSRGVSAAGEWRARTAVSRDTRRSEVATT